MLSLCFLCFSCAISKSLGENEITNGSLIETASKMVSFGFLKNEWFRNSLNDNKN